MMPDLSVRFDGQEAMDRPDCSERKLHRTLGQFRYLNRAVSRYRSLLKRWIVSDMRRDPSRPYHLLDLGAGACDIPVWLLRTCRRAGLRLTVTALDSDPRTLAWARARHHGIPGLRVVRGSAADLPGPGEVDYVFANHLLHHLADADICRLLRDIAAVARRGYLVSDLVRSRSSYVWFSLLARPFLLGSFAYADGRISIRKGFTPEELQRLVHRAGLEDGARLMPCFPGRLVLVGGRLSLGVESPGP